MRIVMIAVGVLLVILISLGIGWLAFRRMLLPQTATNLPPSGARPWSRTRVPNPSSMGGVPALNMDQFNANAALAFGAANNRQMQQNFEPANHGYMQQSNGYEQAGNGYVQPGYDQASNGYVQQGFEPLNNGYMPQGYEQANNGYGQQGYEQINSGYMQQGYEQANNGYMQQGDGYGPQSMNGYAAPQGNGFGTPADGFAGFSDSFIPPSPQMFSQSEISMIPPGTGALPRLNDNHGFAPSSNAFNAMYGLPDDLFASSQPGGSPGWLDNLGNGNGFSEPQLPAMSDFVTGAPDLNDPYLADLIRQYSQKGEAVRPPQQTPQPEQQNGFQNPNWLQ